VMGAQLAVWFSRLMLTLLMLIGHAIGCFMLRQMEYDADSYEIKLAGSDVFETTTRKMHTLGHSLEQAYKNMRVSWNQNRALPENFPAYLMRTDSAVPTAQRQRLEDTMGLGATGLFDTHPSKGDRIRRARRAAQPGVFHLEGPAWALFANFEVPARQVTLLHYQDDLGIPTIGAKLVPENPPPNPLSESAPASAGVPAAAEHPQGEGSKLRVRLKRPS